MQLAAVCATAFYIVPLGSTTPGASAWSLASSFSSSSPAISISMMASTDKRKQPGTRAKLEDYSDYKFAKQQTTSDGACFIVSDEESGCAANQCAFVTSRTRSASEVGDGDSASSKNFVKPFTPISLLNFSGDDVGDGDSDSPAPSS